jgi:hypothetical protein
MSLSFPTSPTTGQVYQGWVWDGAAWGSPFGGAVVNTYNGRSGAVVPLAGDETKGNRTLIMQKVVVPASPVASIDMFYNFTNQYDEYALDIYDLQATVSQNLNLFVSTDGSTFLTDASYAYAMMYTGSTGGAVASGGGNAVSGISIGFTPLVSAGYLGASYTKFALPWTTDRYKYFLSESFTHASGAIYRYSQTGVYLGINGLLPLKGLSIRTAGNITRAVANLYGIAKAGAGGS